MAFSFQESKTPRRYLKFLQVILGGICIGILGYYSTLEGFRCVWKEKYYFMTVSACCLSLSFIYMLVYLEENKGIFFNALFCISYISATIALIVIVVSKIPSCERKIEDYAVPIVIIILAGINSYLLFVDALTAFKSRKILTNKELQISDIRYPVKSRSVSPQEKNNDIFIIYAV